MPCPVDEQFDAGDVATIIRRPEDGESLHADRIEVYLDETVSHRILRATSVGNVRVATSYCQKGTGGRAVYHDLDQRVVLSGKARLSRAGNIISGEDIVIYLPRASAGVWGDRAPADDEVTPRHPNEIDMGLRHTSKRRER